jgi:hypothetical protein
MSEKRIEDPTTDELDKLLGDDTGYVIMQCFTAHPIFLQNIVPALEKGGVHEDLIAGQKNSSLECQLLFLRKVNEFFKPVVNPKTGKKHSLRKTTYGRSIIQASNHQDHF